MPTDNPCYMPIVSKVWTAGSSPCRLFEFASDIEISKVDRIGPFHVAFHHRDQGCSRPAVFGLKPKTRRIIWGLCSGSALPAIKICGIYRG